MRTLKNISIIGSGTALAQGITAIAMPALTRLYAPEAFTDWAIFVSIAAIFSGVATMRFELAMVLPKDRKTAAAIGLGSIGIALVASVFAGFILWIGGPWILEGNTEGSFGLLALLLSLGILSAAIYQIALAWYTREATFKWYALAQFALPTMIIFGQIISAALGQRTGIGLIIGLVGGQTLCACALILNLWKQFKSELLCENKAQFIRHTLFAYRQYPFYMTPYTLVGVLRDRLVYFLLGRCGGTGAAGFYGVAARLVNIPNSFVSSTLRPIVFQQAAGARHSSLENPILITCRGLGIVGVLFLTPCIAQATWFAQLVLGEKWGNAGPYIAALSIPMIGLLMGNWLDRMFDVLGRQRMALTLEVIFSILAMTGLIGGYLVFQDLLVAVWIQSGLLTIYYLSWLGTLFHIAGFKLSRLLVVILEILAVGSVALAIDLGLTVFLLPAGAFVVAVLLSSLVAGLYGYKAWLPIIKGTLNSRRVIQPSEH